MFNERKFGSTCETSEELAEDDVVPSCEKDVILYSFGNYTTDPGFSLDRVREATNAPIAINDAVNEVSYVGLRQGQECTVGAVTFKLLGFTAKKSVRTREEGWQ